MLSKNDLIQIRIIMREEVRSEIKEEFRTGMLPIVNKAIDDRVPGIVIGIVTKIIDERVPKIIAQAIDDRVPPVVEKIIEEKVYPVFTKEILQLWTEIGEFRTEMNDHFKEIKVILHKHESRFQQLKQIVS